MTSMNCVSDLGAELGLCPVLLDEVQPSKTDERTPRPSPIEHTAAPHRNEYPAPDRSTEMTSPAAGVLLLHGFASF